MTTSGLKPLVCILGTLGRLLPPLQGRWCILIWQDVAKVLQSSHSSELDGAKSELLMSLDGLLLAKPVPGHGIVREILVDQQEVHASRLGESNDYGVSSPLHKCIKAVHGAAHLGKQQLGMPPATTSVDLLQATLQELPAPRRLGLDLTVPAQAWSTARLTLLFREAALQPSETSLQAARVARHRLSLFW